MNLLKDANFLTEEQMSELSDFESIPAKVMAEQLTYVDAVRTVITLYTISGRGWGAFDCVGDTKMQSCFGSQMLHGFVKKKCTRLWVIGFNGNTGDLLAQQCDEDKLYR